MGIVGGLILIVIIVFGLAIFGSQLAGLVEDAKEKQTEAKEDQKDTGGPVPSKVGNPVLDTEICNLRVTFVGAVTSHNIYGFIDPFEVELYLWLGSHPLDFLPSFPNYDRSIIQYQWFCQSISPLSFLDFQLQKASLNANSFFAKSQGEEIRMKFEAKSKTTGLSMTDKRGLIVFQNEQKLPFDEAFPIALNIEIFVEDVRQDDYNLEFWSDKDFVGVGGGPKSKGTHYHYDLCESGKSKC